MEESKRKRYEILRAQLELERSSFLSHWKDLGNYILPRRPRFSVTDVNRGDRRNQNIIDATATLAARTLRSGLMSGITSPARPWFRLTTSDQSLNDRSQVKFWLHNVTQRMTSVFLRSNLYNVLPIVYGDLGVFGTAPISIEEDMDTTVRFYSFPVGCYTIANNGKLRVDVFNRDFRMTVRQVVERFGQADKGGDIDWSNISDTVKNYWERGEREAWIDICHVVTPNSEYNPKLLHSKYKRYASCYYERGNQGVSDRGYDVADKLLSEKGYDFFPILCPRWETTGEDVYGTSCPGMEALGDIRALQVMQKRKAQAVEKMVNPPMVGPSSLRNTKTSILPGDITYSDERDGQKGFRPAHEIQFRVQEISMDIQETQRRISRCFYEDLFLMLAQSDRRDITAREIDERHEEKLLALGPVLEQLNQDLLDPLIDATFNIMLRQGQIPEAPQELQGMELKVEYISVMAQAQKMVGISGVERFSQFMMQMASVNQGVLNKWDMEQTADVYADMTSIPPGIVRSDEDTAALHAQQAKAQQQAMAAQQLKDSTSAVKNLSQSEMGGDNALSRLSQGAQAAQGGQ